MCMSISQAYIYNKFIYVEPENVKRGHLKWSCYLPCRCWDSNPGLLQKYPVLLKSLSLISTPPSIYCCVYVYVFGHTLCGGLQITLLRVLFFLRVDPKDPTHFIKIGSNFLYSVNCLSSSFFWNLF